MNRPACFAAAALFLFAISPAVTRAAELPNVVLIVADDLGYADLGCYGADLHESPRIDGLAQEGVRFTDAYAASSVCSPTRASILSGKSPARLHLTIWRESSTNTVMNRPSLPPNTIADLPHDEVTIAEVLRAHGYVTIHIGKWHLGGASHYPETQGFDVNVGGTHWGAPNTFYHPFSGSSYFRDFRYVPGLGVGKPDDYLTDRLTDEALKQVDSAGDRPFFLNMWYHSVHTPIEGKPKTVERFTKKLKPGDHHQNPEYAAMVAHLDENVGRILDYLRERKIERNTIVIFTSDNGGFVNAARPRQDPVTNNFPLRSGKGSLYEGGIRVPLLVRWPSITTAGSVCNTPVISTDLYPTILDMLNLPEDPTHNRLNDGLSVVPLLKDPAASFARKTLCFHYPHYYPTTTPVSAIRCGDWKLLEYFENDRVELYNLHDDLAESRDLSQTNPQQAADLLKRLHSWQQEVDAQLPTKNPGYKPRKPKQ